MGMDMGIEFRLKKLEKKVLAYIVIVVISISTLTLTYIYSQMIESSIANIGRYSDVELSCKRLNNVPRNIVLLIGDGMGYSHFYVLQLVYGYSNMTLLFNNVGIAFTSALDNVVPDSAGAGTAIATGFKTLNRMISMIEINGREIPVPTVLELAKWLGMSVGVVTTTRVTHATPAAFTAHVPHRDMENEIAVQQIALEVDVILGGGRRFYTQDLISEARKRGYTVVFNRSQLLNIDPTRTRRLLGLFAESHLPYVLDRGPEVPSLIEMTAKAIEVLEKNPCGFFLMIEGGRIDHAAHSNDIASVVAETKEFDDVVGFVVSYARSRGDTLVIVTADHETGGLTIGLGVEIPTNIDRILTVRASAEKIASEIRRVGAVREVKDLVYRYTALNISDDDATTMLLDPTPSTVGRTLSKYFGILWSSTDHTAEPVPVLAYGPGATIFSGVYHQTYIAKMIARLMVLGERVSLSYMSAKSPTRGDLNGDGIMDVNDIAMAIYLVGRYVNDHDKVADMNLNGVIDLEDIYIMTQQISQVLKPRS